ncbi:flavin reductase family protein [Portibacter lacus]|uniref:Flavin reductase n=1 Tax=Portibacter lacus TaxID=1099794 RepID=A0AA37WCB8_9BACT|nr:flavin reductase family protein [Portibacter lacus]GLR15868.1 flavin reductase [Portibacter lacus]
MTKIKIQPNIAGVAQTYKLLSSAIAPRPIAFASTVDKEGRVNLSPFSFFNVFGPNPATLVFSPVRSVRTGENKHTLENIKEVPEVSISIVNYSMVEQMSLASTAYEKGVNEYEKSGFTPSESTFIKPPFVSESPVSFECKVKEVIEMGNEGGAGNLVICEVVQIHMDDDYLDESGDLDPKKLDLVARMGGNWYCRANGDALFEIPKPIRSLGMGVDSLPLEVRNSSILTGNNLGRLGNLNRLPSEKELEEYRQTFSLHEEVSIHKAAQVKLEAGETWEALLMLLC